VSDSFETWLESQLNRSLHPVVASAAPPAAQQVLTAAMAGGSALSLGSALSAVSSAMSTKATAGVAAATIAVAGGGYAAGATITGSPNPLNWGQQVRTQVATCQAQRASSARTINHQPEGQETAEDASQERGIGDCVSSFARQNGQNHRSANSGEATTNAAAGNGGAAGAGGNANGGGRSNSAANGKDKSKGHGGPPAGAPPNH
jgi:hypothetical protein